MNCNCGRREEDGIVWNPANREETMQHACMSGTVTRRCSFYGQWEEPVNHDCMCTVTDAPAEMPVIWTPLFETATVDCDVGSRTAYCGGYDHYENQDASQCFCGANSDFARSASAERIATSRRRWPVRWARRAARKWAVWRANAPIPVSGAWWTIRAARAAASTKLPDI